MFRFRGHEDVPPGITLQGRLLPRGRECVQQTPAAAFGSLGVCLRCREPPHPQPCTCLGTYIWGGTEHLAHSAWGRVTGPVHPSPGLPARAEAWVKWHHTSPSLCQILGPPFSLHGWSLKWTSSISASSRCPHQGTQPEAVTILKDDYCCIICHS